MITRRFLAAAVALAMAAVLTLPATPAGAPDYTHPRDMGLPAASFGGYSMGRPPPPSHLHTRPSPISTRIGSLVRFWV